MTTPVPRRMVRLDEDLHEALRSHAFYGKTTITRLVNDLVRKAIPMAEAGILHHDANEIKRALDTVAQEKKES